MPISGFTAISRYGERKLVPKFWQYVRLDQSRQFLGFCDGQIQPPPSPHAASVDCGLQVEVGFENLPQPFKIINPEALRFEEYRALPSVARAIVHEPHRKRLGMFEELPDLGRNNLSTFPIEQSPQFSQDG